MPLYTPQPAGSTSTAGDLELDGTAGDIAALGARAAGSTGKAADAGHVHPFVTAEPLTSGEALFYRAAFTQQQALAASTLMLTYWTAVKTETINNVQTVTGGTAASGLTYANIGIYTIDGSGNLTLAASTGDLHTTLWASTYTKYTSALTSGFSKVAGTRYAMGLLAVGTTPPNLFGQYVSFSGNAPIIAGTVSETTLPGTLTAGSVVAGAYYIAFQAVITP